MGPAREETLTNPPIGTVTEKDLRRFTQGYSKGPSSTDLVSRDSVVVFAHPDLVHLCQRPVHVYIDGTWSTSPFDFMQNLIVMIWDEAYGHCIPVFHCILQRKAFNAYDQALLFCYQAADNKFRPLSVTCDFEQPLLQAIMLRFPRATGIGCFFHWKQAIRRKLKSLNFSENLIQVFMEPGNLDLLCYIDPAEIVSKGIPYLKKKLDYGQDKLMMDCFFSYFVKTWCQFYSPDLWNVHRFKDKWEDIQNRTNNPLERFNRTMNATIPSNPKLCVFMDYIKLISQEWLKKLDDIKNKRIALPEHRPMLYVYPTPEYEAFDPNADVSMSSSESETSTHENSQEYSEENTGSFYEESQEL
jgi:hypothetical protein